MSNINKTFDEFKFSEGVKLYKKYNSEFNNEENKRLTEHYMSNQTSKNIKDFSEMETVDASTQEVELEDAKNIKDLKIFLGFLFFSTLNFTKSLALVSRTHLLINQKI